VRPRLVYLRRIEFESENNTNGNGIGNPIEADPKKHIPREIRSAQK
jgi:hypothetical protein